MKVSGIIYIDYTRRSNYFLTKPLSNDGSKHNSFCKQYFFATTHNFTAEYAEICPRRSFIFSLRYYSIISKRCRAIIIVAHETAL